jgi:hypothetical protein
MPISVLCKRIAKKGTHAQHTHARQCCVRIEKKGTHAQHAYGEAYMKKSNTLTVKENNLLKLSFFGAEVVISASAKHISLASRWSSNSRVDLAEAEPCQTRRILPNVQGSAHQ